MSKTSSFNPTGKNRHDDARTQECCRAEPEAAEVSGTTTATSEKPYALRDTLRRLQVTVSASERAQILEHARAQGFSSVSSYLRAAALADASTNSAAKLIAELAQLHDGLMRCALALSKCAEPPSHPSAIYPTRDALLLQLQELLSQVRQCASAWIKSQAKARPRRESRP